MDPLYVPLTGEFQALNQCHHEYPVPSTLGESSEDDAEDIEVSDSAQEYHNQTYTFRGTAAGLKGILTGEMVPPHGGSKIPISAKAIGRDEMDEFLEHEGRALHIFHNYPHPGFAKLRSIVEPEMGDVHGMSYVVLDSLDVDLGTYIRSRGRLSEDNARGLFRQLVSAVAHAHKHGVVLRHIRLEKIHLTDETQTQLVFADLQGAIVVPRSSDRHCEHRSVYDATTVDVYALGVVLHVMLTGNYPFNRGATVEDDGLAVSSPLEFPSHTTPAACALINRMFDDDLLIRPSVLALLDDPWMQMSARTQSLQRGWGGGRSRGAPRRGSVHVLPLSTDSPLLPELGGRRRSISLEADTDQVVPEAPIQHSQRTRGDSPKRKATPVPQLLRPLTRQRISVHVGAFETALLSRAKSK